MQQFSYDNTYYYKNAHESYKALNELCDKVSEQGDWKLIGELFRSTMSEMLDLSLQAILIDYLIETGLYDQIHDNFYAAILKVELIPLLSQKDSLENIHALVKPMKSVPPILLAVCGKYDLENQTKYSSVFLDRFLTILLSFASLLKRKNNEVLRYIEQFYETMIAYMDKTQSEETVSRRYLFRKISSEENLSYEELLQLPDLKESKEDNEERLSLLLQELDSLIGLDNVKEQVKSHVNLIKVGKMREEYGLPRQQMSYHMVFTGNPGTGKTTVARLLAKIYKELGITKNDTFVETDRSGLVAGYVGQTALKVHAVVEKAIGGVLFIDEAYSLSEHASSNDFGKEAIDTIVKLMEDHRDELVIIVAGYKDEMDSFLSSNPGLSSRFNTYIEFEDYSEEELLEILLSMGKKNKVIFTEEAIEKAKEVIHEFCHYEKKFGNARGIRNLLEQIMVNQANRIVTMRRLSKEDLMTINKNDLNLINFR